VVLHTAAAASGTPLWDDISTVVNASIRTAVVLIAGLVGYARFVRGRVLHSSLAPSLEAEIVEIGGDRAMKVTATIENSGSYRMAFPLNCWQNVKLDCAEDSAWKNALTTNEVIWDESKVPPINLLRVRDITDAGETLEPGEEISKCRIVPIPQGTWVAYRITLQVQSCAQMIWMLREPMIWQAHQILLEHPHA